MTNKDGQVVGWLTRPVGGGSGGQSLGEVLRKLGYDEAAGQRLWQDALQSPDTVQEALPSGQVMRCRAVRRDPNQGAVGVLVEINPPHTTHDTELWMAGQDLRLAASQAQLQQARELMGLVTHQVQKPLGVMQHHCERLERRYPEDASARALGRLAGQLTTLVRQALSLHQQHVEPLRQTRVLELGHLVQQVGETARQTGHRHKIHLHIDTNEPLVVRGEPLRCEQAVLVVLHNAQKYTPAGGVITLKLQRDTPLNRAVLTVTDTGPGVPIAVRGQIFAPFVRGADDAEGTGLGLALCRAIMRRQGGDVWLDESHADGARFVLEWPLLAASE